jgi:hypothetical protein
MDASRFLRFWIFTVLSVALLLGHVQAQGRQSNAEASYGQLPLAFEINQGQSDPRVKFLCRGAGYGLFLTGSDTVLALTRPESAKKPSGAKGVKATGASRQTADVLRIKLLGANPQSPLHGLKPLPGTGNYFIGNDPRQWRTNVPQYAMVKSTAVYPGIDLVYYGRQRQLEYDFQIAPGADPASIRFTIQGARNISINSRGDLVLRTPGGDVIEQAPLIYQEVDGKRQTIGGGYELPRIAEAATDMTTGTPVSFRVASYDRTRPLVIDPVLTYSTYLGGGGQDFGQAIAVDASGNAYITGYTTSSNFPLTPAAYQATFNSPYGDSGEYNVFVAKLNSSGSALVYSTYLGGSISDQAFAIAVDGSGEACIAGTTGSPDFPTTPGAFQNTAAGGFVTKLSANGAGLIYSTYLGITGCTGIAVDGSGNAFVTGYVNSASNFPTTPGAYQTSLGGNQNAFVTQFNATGTALIYSTLIGGTFTDVAQAIALDGSDDAYITGQTGSYNYPVTPGAFQTNLNGDYQAFVTEINPSGSALVYSTLLGGNESDQGNGIAVDGNGDAYVTGQAFSQNFPLTATAFQTVLGSPGGGNAFVTELNPPGSALVYSTFVGGTNSDDATAIAVDGFGDACITGYTNSQNFPTTPGALQPALGSLYGPTAFVTMVNATGTALIYSTYLGGNSIDRGNGIAVDGSGNAYVTGYTSSSNFPIVPGSFETSIAGPQNAFVAKIGVNSYSVEVLPGLNGSVTPTAPQAVPSGGSITYTATPAPGYLVGQWFLDGTPIQYGGDTCTITDVLSDCGVVVSFVPAGQIYFTAPSEEVQNTDGEATVTVTRNFGDAATVDYQTVDDTALAGINYTATQGTLTFTEGQFQQTITVPVIQLDSAPGSTYFSIQLSNPSSGSIVVAPATEGIYILNDETADYGLSQTTSTLPSTAPDSSGSITVDLSSSPDAGTSVGQWRLFGELDWRDSGTTATGLTAGNYEIEFQTESGYQQPDIQVVPLTAASQVVVSGTYTINGSPATGSLQVTLAPQGSGGWRLQGESAWRFSGDTVANLTTGDYILEFEPVTGLVTPQNAEAVVYANQLASVSITYLVADSTIGQPPVLVSDSIAQTQAPYVFTGQIQTDEGLGSGFVPLDRVVVTAAHVLFDDSTLSYVQGVRWFSQYESGVFEAPAQIPTGSYILSGYAAQRTVDIGSGVSPGVATTASRQLDAAALYFLEPAARGGQSGYLASDSGSNGWLTGMRDKFIAGYPVTGVTPTGCLYATPVVQNAFQSITGGLFSTTAITSYSGNSGGPLFVRFDDGNFYPAAIYLGGSAETVVHAIDSDVISLMKEAEISGNGGVNNSGGGIIQVTEGVSGATAFALGNVKVTLSPSGAVSNGAYWEIGDGIKRYSGQSAIGLAPGPCTVQFFTSGGGYAAPAQTIISVAAGNETDVTATYTPNPPTITSGTQSTAIEGQSFNYQATVTPGATGYAITSGVLPSGLTLNAATGLISGIVPVGAATGLFPISLQATNSEGPGNSLTLSLKVAQPGTLTVSMSGKGTVSKLLPNPQAVGSSISVKATPATGYLFAYWSDADTGNVLSTQQVYTFTMTALLNLQANFSANPFLTAKGSYLALLQGSDYEHSGSAQMTVTPAGGFTATFTLGGSSAKVVNAFNNQGEYQGEFEIHGVGLFNATLSLTAGGVLSGSLINQNDGSQIQLNTQRIAPRADQAVAGTYTVLLPAPSGTASPGGNGYGTLTLSKTGAVKFSGKLGDGLPVTLSGSLDGNGAWPFLFSRPAGLKTGAELLLGSVSFPPAASGTAGTLTWYRTANTKDLVYPTGFSTTIPFETGRYTAPATGYSSASVTFSGLDLGNPVVEPISIVSGRIIPGGATPFTLKFTAGTGLFTGSFPDHGVTRAFAGAVLQSGSTGMGLFQEPSGATDSVVLQATQ